MEDRDLIRLIYHSNLSGLNIEKLFRYLLARQNIEEIKIDIEISPETLPDQMKMKGVIKNGI